MPNTLNIQKLADMLRSKRGGKGLRETAKEIGNVSASTLSRVEKGNLPDTETFILLCNWLNVPTDFFVIKDQETTETTEDVIVAHLRADRALDPETADALIRMITLAYKNAQEPEEE